MGTRKLVLSAAAVIFLLIAVASLYRLLVGFPITIGGQEIGQVITFLVLVVSIAFSAMLFKEARSGRTPM
jgi:hypothetical protein